MTPEEILAMLEEEYNVIGYQSGIWSRNYRNGVLDGIEIAMNRIRKEMEARNEANRNGL